MQQPDASSEKPTAIALMGPTAAGKTDLAIALVEALGAEIISVDSAMVYRGLDIGSAKPSAGELARAPHRLIDICDPSEPYSAADFCRDAEREMEAVIGRGKIPLLVGGTMMYFKALLEGLSDMPASDPQVRAAIEVEAQTRGWPAMHRQLEQVDPATAAGIHPNHSQRISRALEVFRISGKPISEFRGQSGGGALTRFNWYQFAIAPRDRTLLHQRIALRFDKMLEQGFEQEVRALYERGDLHADLPAIRAVGYRQMWEYLAGECDWQTMHERGIAATRQLAKRQFTWLRRWPDLHWLYTQTETGSAVTLQEIANKTLNFLAKRTI